MACPARMRSAYDSLQCVWCIASLCMHAGAGGKRECVYVNECIWNAILQAVRGGARRVAQQVRRSCCCWRTSPPQVYAHKPLISLAALRTSQHTTPTPLRPPPLRPALAGVASTPRCSQALTPTPLCPQCSNAHTKARNAHTQALTHKLTHKLTHRPAHTNAHTQALTPTRSPAPRTHMTRATTSTFCSGRCGRTKGVYSLYARG